MEMDYHAITSTHADQRKKRLAWIDYAKCFSIILVISYHIPQHPEGYWGNILQLLRMPAFFMIAGYLFKIEKFPSLSYFIKHRSIQLLVPYTFFFIIFYVLWLTFGREIAQGEDMEVPLWYPLFEFVYGTPYLVVAPYWFICCLFSIQIIYFLLMKYLPKPLAITIILLCPLLHSILGIYNLPWNLALATLYLPFYAFSNLCKDFISRLSVRQLPLVVSCLMIALIGIYYFNYFSGMAKDILTIIYGILILPTYILLIKGIACVKTSQTIERIGKNTIVILALQNYIIGAFKILLPHAINNGGCAINLIFTLLIIALCYIPIMFINKYTPFLIGRGTYFEKKLKIKQP